MKAIVLTKYGSPDGLKLVVIPQPVPKTNEVLVEVHAASINSWDWEIVKGTPFVNRMTFGLFKPKKNVILGCDIAGMVVALGGNVKRLKVGDKVFGDISKSGWGGFAEFVCTDENALSLKPEKLSFVDAAASPQAGLLAVQGLLRIGHLKKGQKVLINGAGGGAGTFAVQIAKHLGTEVTGVDSAEKLATIKSLGADHVIDYAKVDFTKNGKKYDLIWDVMTTRSISAYKRALLPKGEYVTVGGYTPKLLRVILFGRLFPGDKKIRLLIHKPNKSLDLLVRFFEEGKVKPVIDKLFPLNKVPEAFRYFGEGQFKGKVVIKLE